MNGTLSSGRGTLVPCVCACGGVRACVCVSLSLCVCDTDGCTNGKTDRCLGGSNGRRRRSGAHSRGEIASGNNVVLRTEADDRSGGTAPVWCAQIGGFYEKRFFFSFLLLTKKWEGAAAHLTQRKTGREEGEGQKRVKEWGGGERQPLATHPYLPWSSVFSTKTLHPLIRRPPPKNTGEDFCLTPKRKKKNKKNFLNKKIKKSTQLYKTELTKVLNVFVNIYNDKWKRK